MVGLHRDKASIAIENDIASISVSGGSKTGASSGRLVFDSGLLFDAGWLFDATGATSITGEKAKVSLVKD